MKKFIQKVQGFTMIEVLIVIAIIGILAAIIIPMFTGGASPDGIQRFR